MLAIGADIASRTGWGVVESTGGHETALEHGIVDVAMDTPLWEQIDRVLDKGRHVAVVALEMPWLGDNPHTLEVLARLTGQWEHACSMRGLEYVLVRPGQWQPAILTGLIDTHSKREQRNRAARMWCRATFGLDLEDDEADGLAIATWACRTRLARARGLTR